MNQLKVGGRVVEPKIGWHQLDDECGARFHSRIGWRVEGRTDKAIEWNSSHVDSLGPRSIRTLRFDEAIPTPYYMPGHETSDWFDGGLHGMDLCGITSTAREWDRVMARMPVSLTDYTDGTLPPLAGIERPTIGVYSLERSGDTSVLPGFGAPWEKAFNGQHLLRAWRWCANLPRDEFIAADIKAIARDCALALDRAWLQTILKEPGGQGSPRIGREAAFCLMFAVGAGDVELRDRICKAMKHTQSDYGNFQLNSGGNPAPPPGAWFSDAEADYLTVAARMAGMNREAKKQADVAIGCGPRGKYIEVGTGRGDQAPTHGTSWGGMGCGVYSTLEVQRIAKLFDVGPYPDGSMRPRSTSLTTVKKNLLDWNQPGKSAWVLAKLP